MSSVYQINKGINRPIEFKGLKGQYIWYLGIGLVVLLVVFAGLYLIGVSIYCCLVVVVLLGAGLFVLVYGLSKAHGEFGLMKKVALRSVPKALRGCSVKRLSLVVRKKRL